MTESKLEQEFADKLENDFSEEHHVNSKEDFESKVPELESYKILIEVVNDIEFMTAICQMEGKVYQCTVQDYLTKKDSIYFYGKWKDVPVVIVKTGKKVGPHFQSGSWFETKKALYYMPELKYVFAVGVCGSAVDDDGGSIKPRVPLGHVVVSSHIIGYDHQKKKPKCDENRSYFSNLTQNNFYEFLNEPIHKQRWKKGLHFGRILSGSWLVADIEAQKLVLDPKRKDEIAFEMEGIGIAAACSNNTVECFLIVKGVSDYADSKKGDTWQPAAARNAVGYLSNMINKVM